MKPSNKCKKKPWLNKEAILSIKDKQRAWTKYSYCKTKQNYQHYAEKRNTATRTCRLAKINFEREIARNIKSDSKSFWNYVRSQSKTKSAIGDLESDNGTLTSSDLCKAELLNAFFVSVFTEEDTSYIPSINEKSFNEPLADIYISPEMVKKKLCQLKTSKSPGIDAVHPLLLKECHEEICDIVTKLFNMSITSEEIPNL